MRFDVVLVLGVCAGVLGSPCANVLVLQVCVGVLPCACSGVFAFAEIMCLRVGMLVYFHIGVRLPTGVLVRFDELFLLAYVKKTCLFAGPDLDVREDLTHKYELGLAADFLNTAHLAPKLDSLFPWGRKLPPLSSTR